MSEPPQSLLGISFDGLGISGVVNEFLNVADILRHRLRVLFDVGYDITAGRTKEGRAWFPPWVKLLRSLGDPPPQSYVPKLVADVIARVNKDGAPVASLADYANVCSQLASALVATFERENVRLIVVENGTLPDNPLFTEALYQAIGEYGRRRKFGKYVLWRDHDMMWSAEPHYYGSYPYPGVRKPDDCEHIYYAVATEWMRLRMSAWAPSAQYQVIPNRFFKPNLKGNVVRLRATYGIPEDAYLIARCSRIVPQKCIERDLRLLKKIQMRLKASQNPKEAFLFVTGPLKEDHQEYRRLVKIANELGVAKNIIWGDGLLPFNPTLIDISNNPGFSVQDLLRETDLSSFLTSYDYEGFGNPPGESMAMSVPYIATTYELYEEVYGSKGAVAPLLPINRSSTASDPMPEFFIEWTLKTLTDGEYREQITARNQQVCERFYSLSALERQITDLFKDF